MELASKNLFVALKRKGELNPYAQSTVTSSKPAQ